MKNDGAQDAKKQRKKMSPLRFLLNMIFSFLLALIAIYVVLTMISLVQRQKTYEHIPPGYSAYLCVPSASSLAQQVIHLDAASSLLVGSDYMEIAGLLRSLRVQGTLDSFFVRRLGDVRLDAAVYADGGFVAAVDMGLRSGLLPAVKLFATQILPGMEIGSQIRFHDDGFPHYQVQAGDSVLYLAIHRNLVLLASSRQLLQAAVAGDFRSVVVRPPKKDSMLRVLIPSDVISVTENSGSRGAESGFLQQLVSALVIEDSLIVDLLPDNEHVYLHATAALSSSDELLHTLLTRSSETPAVLSRLPESVEYFSLLHIAQVESLWDTFEPYLGSAADAKRTADRAARMALGGSIDDLIFSWIGDEVGVFGTSFGPSPVFFVRIADEQRRRQVFETIFASLLAGQDVSAVVNGRRIPRIVFPSFITGFLQALEIQLSEPFYLESDGILYASNSAEVLAAAVEQINNNDLMVRTRRWDRLMNNISGQSSAMMYYDVNRSLPFFLRSNAAIGQALGLYDVGALSLRIDDEILSLDFSAMRSGTREVADLPGFPLQAESRFDSSPYSGITPEGDPMLYWVSGSSVQGMNPASGTRVALEMDDSGYVVPVYDKHGIISALWAVSARGTVYYLDSQLDPYEGFPVFSGQTVSGPPTGFSDRVAIPLRDGRILIVQLDGNRMFSGHLGGYSRSGLAAGAGYIAIIPRSFDSSMYLLRADGSLLTGWPQPLSGIAAAAPLIVPDGEDSLVCALTEGGIFSVYSPEGEVQEGFPVSLPGVFTASPVWLSDVSAYLLVSVQGDVFLIDHHGLIRRRVHVDGIRGREIRVFVADLTRDGRQDIFIGSESNRIVGLKSDLSLLPSFSAAGRGRSSSLDVDGDGQLELITAGLDNKIHAYSFPEDDRW